MAAFVSFSVLTKILRPVIEYGLPPLLLFQWFTDGLLPINETLILVLCGFYILIIFFKIKRWQKKDGQIQNALFAKDTFTKLNHEDQKAALALVFTILKRGGSHSPEESFNKFSEFQRYGYIALSLAELNIPPTDKRYSWHWVEQPQIIPPGTERKLREAEKFFHHRYGSKITLEI